MQYGFYINVSKCTGCKACQISCKDEKNNPIDINFLRVHEYSDGDWHQVNGLWDNNTYAYYLPIACYHCNNPTCIQACPNQSISKRQEDGIVIINENTCTGCRDCESYCPYEALQFNPRRKIMTKCDGCHDKMEEGNNATCVDACPHFALEFDDIEVLRNKYGNECNIATLPDANLTLPNLVITPHENTHQHHSKLEKHSTLKKCN